MQCAVGLHHIAQCSVHPKAHGRVALVGLNVNVAGPVARSLRQQGVQHADDGRVVSGLQQVFHRRQFLHHAAEVGIALHLTHYGGGTAVAPAERRVGRADALRQHPCGVALQAAGAVLAHHFAQGRQACHGQRLFLFGFGRFGASPVQAGVVAILLEQQQVFAGKGVGQRVLHAGTLLGGGLRGHCRQHRIGE